MKILIIPKHSDNSYFFTVDGEISDPFFSKDKGLDFITLELIHDKGIEYSLAIKLLTELWNYPQYPVCIKLRKEDIFTFEKRVEKINKHKDKLLYDFSNFDSMPKKVKHQTEGEKESSPENFTNPRSMLVRKLIEVPKALKVPSDQIISQT